MSLGRTIASGATALLVAGCGGGSGLSDEERVAEFAAIADRLGSRFNTAFLEEGAIPTSGEAVFEGYAGIVIERPADDLALLGDARLTIDFGRDRVTGRIDTVIGDDGGRLESYSGSIALVNGVMGATRPNDFSFDYSGALAGQGNSIFLDGSGAGVLKGTPIRGVLAASDPADTVLLNGVEAPSTLSIAAEMR